MPRGSTNSANAAKTRCPNGHAYTPENTYSNHGKRECRTCKRERKAAWDATHKAEQRAYFLAYYPLHREEILANNYRWMRVDPERTKLKNQVSNARRKEAPGHCTPEQLAARIAFFGGKCWMCGAPWEHIDHVKPLAKGGSNWPANLRPACSTCNLRKSDQWPLPSLAG
jgi:5-methylcytosine-specific restriction endonuclease McrA